jgi:phage repressor protein C with HTH and peptisase S24 domain
MVSRRVGDFIEASGISYYAFENSIGASRGAISKAVKEEKSIGSNVLEKIMGQYPQINPEWLLTGKGTMIAEGAEIPQAVRQYRLRTDVPVESQKIPLFNLEAVAGLLPLFGSATAQQPIDHISIPQLPKCDGAIYVTGNSMQPILNSGDIVMYKIMQDIRSSIFYGEMYLLGLDMAGDEYVTVKYIHKSEQPGHIKLVSENPAHQPMDVEMEKIRALALIKASIRISAMK